MANMAEFITRRWPDSPDADAAFSVLVSYAIRTNRIDEAESLLGEASEASRPRLELQLGNAMWGRYLELQADDSEQADPAKLEELKSSAVKYLQRGFEAARSEPDVTEAAAAAGLYLVHVLLSDGNYDEAIELLEDDDLGPLTLVTRGAPAASKPQFITEVYKAALRAYVSATPPRSQQAIAIMDSLEATTGNEDGAGQEQLTRIYMGLGGTLQRQITELREAGRNDDADRVAAAFTEFLERLRTRQERTTTWPLAKTPRMPASLWCRLASPRAPRATTCRRPAKPINNSWRRLRRIRNCRPMKTQFSA
jgi:hypothetical protein